MNILLDLLHLEVHYLQLKRDRSHDIGYGLMGIVEKILNTAYGWMFVDK